MLHSIDHVNLVVSDLERMCAFYCDALGFTVSKRVTIEGDWIDRVVGLSGVRAEVVYLELAEGPRLELLKFLSPPVPQRPDGLGESNTPGLRHVAFRVSDIDAMVARLRS